MSITRRDFNQVLALSAVASCLRVGKAFGQATPIPRMKLEDFVTSPQRVDALKLGVRTMKSRKPSDPTSWFYQAAVHAVSPEAVTQATAEDPAVAHVDQAKFWNRCPVRHRRTSSFGIGGMSIISSASCGRHQVIRPSAFPIGTTPTRPSEAFRGSSLNGNRTRPTLRRTRSTMNAASLPSCSGSIS